MDENLHEILDAYKESNEPYNIGITAVGIACMGFGMIKDNIPITIVGSFLLGIIALEELKEYVKAYYSARLDYMLNNKFTRLKK